MKYMISIVFFAVIILLIIGVVNFEGTSTHHSFMENIRGNVEYIRRWVRVKTHNIGVEHDWSFLKGPWSRGGEDYAQRRPPTSFMLTKVQMSQFLPDDFVRELSEDDWNYIFSLIYEPIEDWQGEFMIKRYLTREEVETELINEFRYPFFNFQKRHWDHFWSIVLR